MAQLPKIYAPTPAQSVAAARGIPASRVASQSGQIEESNGSLPTAFDTAPFVLQDDLRRDARFGQNGQQNSSRHHGRLVVPSQDFTSLVEYYGANSANDDDPAIRARQIGGIIGKAIQTYENNAKIIHGEPDVTGTEISIRI